MSAELEQQLAALRPGEHLCPIYEADAERWSIAVRFVSEGLAHGERCIHVADESTAAEMSGHLTAAGVDVAAECARDRLRLLTPRESFLRGRRFDPTRMIERLRRWEAEALEAGCTGLRLVGEMTWALQAKVPPRRLVEYEALLNDYLRGSRTLIICQYHRSRFKPELIQEVVRAHPLVVLGGGVPVEISLPRVAEGRTGKGGGR